jgi:hypothetical protein
MIEDRQAKIETVSAADMAAAAVVGPAASLHSLRLVKLESEIRGELDQEDVLERMLIEHRFARAKDNRSVRVELRFRFEIAKYGAATEPEPLVLVMASFAIVYSVTGLESISDEQIYAFAKVNGVFNAWPYWRELHSSVLWRMGLPLPALPTLRVQSEKTPAE